MGAEIIDGNKDSNSVLPSHLRHALAWLRVRSNGPGLGEALEHTEVQQAMVQATRQAQDAWAREQGAGVQPWYEMGHRPVLVAMARPGA